MSGLTLGWSAAVLALVSTACAARAVQENRPEAPGPVGTPLSYEGQVFVAGSAGSTVTTIFVTGRGSLGVVGALEPEVRRLAGARVRVQGPRGSGVPGEAVDVRSYQVLEVNGQRPYVGVLAESALGLLLEQSATETLPLSPGPPGLSENVGAKVWVTGDLSGGRLQVQAYGIIRPR